MKEIIYYGVCQDDTFGNYAEYRFADSEVARAFIKEKLVPEFRPHIQKLECDYITERTPFEREVEEKTYYKNNPARVRSTKMVTVKDCRTEYVHDYRGYVNLQTFHSDCRWQTDPGYFECRAEEIQIEDKETSVVFTAEVSIRFITAKLIQRHEIKEEGKPYVPASKEVLVEAESPWLPLYVKEGKFSISEDYLKQDWSWNQKTKRHTERKVIYISEEKLSLAESVEEVVS